MRTWQSSESSDFLCQYLVVNNYHSEYSVVVDPSWRVFSLLSSKGACDLRHMVRLIFRETSTREFRLLVSAAVHTQIPFVFQYHQIMSHFPNCLCLPPFLKSTHSIKVSFHPQRGRSVIPYRSAIAPSYFSSLCFRLPRIALSQLAKNLFKKCLNVQE